jgi:hypothetical protein
MPTICWKTHPPNITNMLSIKKSSMMMISVSENILVESRVFYFYRNEAGPIL